MVCALPPGSGCAGAGDSDAGVGVAASVSSAGDSLGGACGWLGAPPCAPPPPPQAPRSNTDTTTSSKRTAPFVICISSRVLCAPSGRALVGSGYATCALVAETPRPDPSQG